MLRQRMLYVTCSICAVRSQENYCHHMSDFKAKMHLNRFRLELRQIQLGELNYSDHSNALYIAGIKWTYF